MAAWKGKQAVSEKTQSATPRLFMTTVFQQLGCVPLSLLTEGLNIFSAILRLARYFISVPLWNSQLGNAHGHLICIPPGPARFLILGTFFQQFIAANVTPNCNEVRHTQFFFSSGIVIDVSPNILTR